MPGPVLGVTVAETLKRGFIASVLVSSGHALIELLWVIGISLGVFNILKDPIFGKMISLLGGGLLLWMGISMATEVFRGKPVLSLDEGRGSNRKMGPLLAGAVATIANPFWHIWWATVGTTYIVQAKSSGFGSDGSAAFYIGHILSDYSWYCLVGFVVAFGKGFMSDRVYKFLIFGCGIFLIGMGFYFLSTAQMIF